MAQLNPNFEIDFNDINSYEQIQLIKDTQLAKENLLMHRAYKEPAEDEIIRNQFSSFTFVDFCPKLFTTEGVGGTSSPGSLSRANSRPSSSARMANNNIQECGERLDYQRDPHGQAPVSSPTLSRGSKSLRQHNYELETFSDLFDRINAWLKLNKDWRVVSMETLIFDCTSQFNHLKSSIQSSYLPKNMRGLRLYLSPSKSRFSGPQKIGCINVIPRKISGRYRSAGGGAVNEEEPLQYENLDQILARLNELLLTRPIEGRILSVETITLPIVDGYVNTETNYFMDNRLNLLNESIYTHANTFGTSTGTSSGASSGGGGGAAGPAASCQATGEQRTVDGVDRETAAGVQHEPIVAQQAANNWVTNRLRGGLDGSGNQSSHGLIDILRVYYEFGSMVCGLVNLIDFLPRLHRNQQQPAAMTGFESDHLDTPASATMDEQQQQAAAAAAAAAASGANSTGIESSESLTRLVKRSLAWFELERKRIMHETSRRSGGSAAGENTSDDDDDDDDDDDGDDDDDDDDAEGNNANASGVSWRNQHRKVDLKVCNLQVHHKIMLKGQLAKVSPQNVFETVRTRQMYHEPPREPIVCQQCQLSSAMHHVREWCQHLLNLDQAYELKFVRLAYVVPVYNKYAASRLMSVYAPQPPWPRSAPSSSQTVAAAGAATALPTTSKLNDDSAGHDETAQLESGAPRLDPSGEAATGAGSSSPAGIDLINDLDNNDDVDGDENDEGGGEDDENEDDDDDDDSDDDSGDDDEDDDLVAMEGALMEARDAAERLAKEASLEIVRSTNERQRASELALQLGSGDEDEQSSLIGQLTYRLFAPCQLVNSSSCFSINPVNSSSPLSRRGSVNLNGSGTSATSTGLSSENAVLSALLLPPTSASSLSNFSESMISINQQHQVHAGGPLLTSPTSNHHHHHHHQQTISFGALFPSLSHDIIHGGAQFGKQAATNALPGSATGHFTTNEFESVDAIRRRMEIYVTTNSMKVVAGETLVVNLSDQLSCLSTAISETIVKASFSPARPVSTWVSVYILYAAVDEPHLPSQLLERQRLRERLALISEGEEGQEQAAASSSGTATPSRKVSKSELKAAAGSGESVANSVGQDNMMPVFDDDFCTADPGQSSSTAATAAARRGSRLEGVAAGNSQAVASSSGDSGGQADGKQAPTPLALRNQADGSIRVELERDPSASLYNSAYDRTVALPSQPDNQLSDYLEPVDFNLNPQQLAADGLWFQDENDLNAASPSVGGHGPWPHHHQQHGLISLTSVSVRAAQRQMRLRQSGATKSKAAYEKRKNKPKKEKNSAKRLSGSSGGHSEDSQCSMM